MKRINLVITFILFGISSLANAQDITARRPYAAPALLPANGDTVVLNKRLKTYFDYWKKLYIKPGPGADETHVYFVDRDQRHLFETSEAQGYGLTILALMGKREDYDSLFRYTKNRPCSPNSSLMQWAQPDKKSDTSSATDGDIDIAYSLLLAAKRWPEGAVEYQKEAHTMIDDIMKYDVNKDTWLLMIANTEFRKPGDTTNNYYVTRPSDFIPASLKEFATFTGDARWTKVVDAEYNLFFRLQHDYGSGIGLVPDFVQKDSGIVDLVPPGKIVETDDDGHYFNNACRVPWRIGVDYLSGEKRAATFLQPVNRFIETTATGEDVEKLSAGYDLYGKSLNDYNEYFFNAPMAVAAMADTNKEWLNKLWAFMLSGRHFTKKHVADYYGETINMIDLIIVSGKYWPAYSTN